MTQDLVYIKSLETMGTVEAVWKDGSMYYVTPMDSKYGNWFLANDLTKVDAKDFYEALWQMAEDDLDDNG